MLGEMQLFNWKSKKQQAKEAAEYEVFAFPHGAKQREILEGYFEELFPEEKVPVALVAFLSCKEVYVELLAQTDDQVRIIASMKKNLAKYKRFIPKKDLTTYLALVVVDSNVDENLDYASIDEIRTLAKKFDAIEVKI